MVCRRLDRAPRLCPPARGLTWAAIGCAVLLGWRMGPRPTASGTGGLLSFLPRLVLLLAALAAAVPMIASDTAVIHVFAVALVLLAVSLGRREDGMGNAGTKAILLAAEAVAVLGIFLLAYTSIGWFWMLCDALGHAIGSAAGYLYRQPLWVGATFAGLDFLVVMLYLAVRGPLLLARRRRALAADSSPKRHAPSRSPLVQIPLAIGCVLFAHMAIYMPVITRAVAVGDRRQPSGRTSPQGYEAAEGSLDVFSRRPHGCLEPEPPAG